MITKVRERIGMSTPQLAPARFRIPLCVQGGRVVDLVVEPHEYGYRRSVTIRVPEECKGVLHLPRWLLHEMARWQEDVSDASIS